MTTNRWFLRVLQVVTILLAAAMLSLPLRSERLLVNKPLTEDGYYAFTVARNIALGRGITADGHHRTNGFQPLQTFLTVPVFLVCGGNRILPIRLILALHWLAVLATATLLALIARDLMPSGDTRARALIPWVTALIYLASVPVLLNAFNGLETGLLLLCLAAAWRFHQARGLDSSLNRLLFGALLGVTVLARVDAVFLVLAFVFCCLFYDVSLPVGRRILSGGQQAAGVGEGSGPAGLVALREQRRPRAPQDHADRNRRGEADEVDDDAVGGAHVGHIEERHRQLGDMVQRGENAPPGDLPLLLGKAAGGHQ